MVKFLYDLFITIAIPFIICANIYITQYTGFTLERIKAIEKVCSDSSSEISIVYKDGDFKCKNGAEFPRSKVKL